MPTQPTDQNCKTFVLDTNVLLHTPNAITVFDEHEVVIPFTVLTELDKFKTEGSEVGRNARATIRALDGLRMIGSLSEGVLVGRAGGRLRVEFADRVIDMESKPSWFADDSPDSRIIAVAYGLKQQGKPVVLISKDINVRLRADSLGIAVEDFENQKVDSDLLYTGYMDVVVADELVNRLYSQGYLDTSELVGSTSNGTEGETVEFTGDQMMANQFVTLISDANSHHKGVAWRKGGKDQIVPMSKGRKPVYGVMGRNLQQSMALDLLLDEDVKLVTLIGAAGSGKTLLALAAGMQHVMNEDRYDKLLVARPIMPMGRDIGFLPGDKDEKLSAWMQPIFDNLSYLMSTRGENNNQHADSQPLESRVKDIMSAGRLVLEPLTYIRGRSIPRQYIIIDEAQNLSPHEVKTIISRAGEDTKIILTGDIGQIDHPYLDADSNGMSYVIDRMKNQTQVGHITLLKSERSELASLAAKLL